MKVHELVTALATMPDNDEVQFEDLEEFWHPLRTVRHQSTYGEHYVVISAEDAP